MLKYFERRDDLVHQISVSSRLCCIAQQNYLPIEMADTTVQSEKKSRFRAPHLHVPEFNKRSLGLTTHVDYAKYNPNSEQSTHGRKSLVDLDYSPLRRITWASFNMGVLVSMGGFIFGYDTYEIFILMPTTTLLT